MTLDPLAKAFLEQISASPRPKIWEVPIAAAREGFRATVKAFGPKDVPIGKVETIAMPGPGGDLALRVYTPVAAGGEALPALVFFHGGGFVTGDFESHEATCRFLAGEGGCRVIAVDYRLAPEHKFPAAVDDAFAATRWIERNAVALGVDPNRIAVGGDSAGGNLAAVVCLLAKAQGGPKLACQLLLFPVTQFGSAFASMNAYATGYLLEKPTIDWCYASYAPPGTALSDFRLSPLLADNHAGLPPAYVMLAGHDPLHDEGLAYAGKLDAAGVNVTLVDHQGLVHGFILFQTVLPQAREALADAAKSLREAFEEA